VEATRGGKETIYPEYRAKLKTLPKPGTTAAAAPAPVGAAAARPADIQQNRPQQRSDGEIHVQPVSGNIYMIVGAGSNITASVGRDGVMLVDTGSAQMSDKVLAAIKKLSTEITATPIPRTSCVGLRCGDFTNPYGWSSPFINATINSLPAPQPIRYIISTSIDPDHTGGNQKVAAAGTTLVGGNITGTIGNAGEGSTVLAHETVLDRMTQAGAPSRALPTETYHFESYKFSQFFNGEGVQIYHAPKAHTDGDSMVYFRFSDVLAAGDVYSTVSYPVIDLEKGGTFQGIIDGLNHILDIAIAEFRSQGGTLVVPGHGYVSDTGDVANYRNMLVIIRDRVQDMIKKGMTLEQVKAARPSMDYDGRYGSTTAPWTTGMFIEAVYRSLSPKR
jgi:glyoxylase-like metal-dependent hydrolase (beta-lactamase superfamily II)